MVTLLRFVLIGLCAYRCALHTVRAIGAMRAGLEDMMDRIYVALSLLFATIYAFALGLALR